MFAAKPVKQVRIQAELGQSLTVFWRPALLSDLSAAKWPIIVRHLWHSLGCGVKLVPPTPKN